MNRPFIDHRDAPAVFEQLSNALRANRESYKEQWIPYMQQFPQHWERLVPQTTTVEEFQEAVEFAPFARHEFKPNNKVTLDQLERRGFERHVSHLNLTDYEVEPENLKHLLALPLMNKITQLTLSTPSLTVKRWGDKTDVAGLWLKAIVEADGALSALKTLDLSMVTLTSEHLTVLAHVCARGPLECLKLNFCGVDDDALLSTRGSDAWRSIQRLELGNNSVKLSTIGLMLDSEAWPALREVSMRQNNLSKMSMNIFYDYQSASRLTHLDLSMNPLGTKGLRPVHLMETFQGLTDLNLMATELGNMTLQDLATSPAFDGLEALDLSSNMITPKGLVPWLESGHVKALRHLSLSCNSIDASGAKALANTSGLQNLVELNLSGNPIGDEGAFALAESRNLSNLAYLNLFNCGLGEEGARAILDSPHLEHVVRASFTV